LASVSQLLMDKQWFKHGGLISPQNALCFRSFFAIFCENYVFYDILRTFFLALRLGMILFYVLQMFGPFYPKFDNK